MTSTKVTPIQRTQPIGSGTTGVLTTYVGGRHRFLTPQERRFVREQFELGRSIHSLRAELRVKYEQIEIALGRGSRNDKIAA